MPRLPLIAALLIALLSLAAAPLAVAAPPAPVAHAAIDDDDGDDEWAFEDEECDAECADDDLCVVDWEDADVVASAEDDEEWGDWSDEDPGEDWESCDEDEGDWSDEDDEEAAAPAVRLSRLHATAARLGAVLVSFRLDRGSRVTLTLQRLGGAARASGKPQAVRGAVEVSGRRGANETTLRRWKDRALQSGRYRLTATPASGRAATTDFTLRVARAARRS